MKRKTETEENAADALGQQGVKHPGALINALQTQSRLRQLYGWEGDGQMPSARTFSPGFSAFAREQ